MPVAACVWHSARANVAALFLLIFSTGRPLLPGSHGQQVAAVAECGSHSAARFARIKP
jgi:hypothetical protein